MKLLEVLDLVRYIARLFGSLNITCDFHVIDIKIVNGGDVCSLCTLTCSRIKLHIVYMSNSDIKIR